MAVTVTSTAHAVPIAGSGAISSVNLSATNATGATTSPFPLANFGNANTNGFVSSDPIQIANGGNIVFQPNVSSPMAGVYDGTVSNVAISPFTGTGLTPGNYLVAQNNDPVTINLGRIQNSFSLLWGTVDTYNQVSLNLHVYQLGIDLGSVTITGTDVAHAAGISANGSTPAFVTISDPVFSTFLGSIPSGFDQIVITNLTQPAFEFVPDVQVPEPMSLALVGTGLAGLGFVRRRKTEA